MFGTQKVEAFFCGHLDITEHPYFETIATLKVSSHLFIDRHGEMIQFVPFEKRAWHAGESFFDGRFRCNDFSIGIELEGSDDLPYEKVQYQHLAEVIKALQQRYPAITRERILGHSDVAPSRKKDPGPLFDWTYLDTLLKGYTI
jgi:AmpD protein